MLHPPACKSLSSLRADSKEASRMAAGALVVGAAMAPRANREMMTKNCMAATKDWCQKIFAKEWAGCSERGSRGK